MARKKRGLGKFLGAIAGSPYERLLKQVDKLVETSVNERMLAKNLEKLVSITAETVSYTHLTLPTILLV